MNVIFMLDPGEHWLGVFETIPRMIGTCGGGGSPRAKEDTTRNILVIRLMTFIVIVFRGPIMHFDLPLENERCQK